MRLDRLSIRARLTAAFAAALVLMLALMALFLYLRVSNDLSNAIDTGLRSRADTLAALVAGAEAASPELGNGRLVEGDEGFSQVLRPDGTVIGSTLRRGAGAVLSRQEVASATRRSVLLEERKVPGIEAKARVLARPARSDRGRVIVVAGSSVQDRREALSGLTRAFLIGAPVAIALSCALGYLLAGRALAPVAGMRRRAAEITLARSGERLPLAGADDEIRQLGVTLNAMLERIEAVLERERVFVADASHELRTPLSILRTELELADRPGRSAEELRAALHSAAEEVDRLSQLAEDLLVIARSDQGRLPVAREDVELGALLERVRERFATRARAAGRKIEVEAPGDAPVELDPLRVEQALGNLVDNALRHGAGEVWLSATRNGADALLAVSDQGSGFPAGFEAEAFQRFTRADDGRTGGGAGLGLAITRAIADAHNGQVSITQTRGGRTTVQIALPVGHDPQTARD